MSKKEINKVGGIVVQNRKVLAVRSRGKEVFTTPGGKVEKGESDFRALRREMMEEVEIRFGKHDIESIGEFRSVAAERPNRLIKLSAFLINEFQGAPTPSSEIEELAWVDSTTSDVYLSSIMEQHIIPYLLVRGFID